MLTEEIDMTDVKRYSHKENGVITSLSKTKITTTELMRDLSYAVDRKAALEEAIDNMKKKLLTALYSDD